MTGAPRQGRLDRLVAAVGASRRRRALATAFLAAAVPSLAFGLAWLDTRFEGGWVVVATSAPVLVPLLVVATLGFPRQARHVFLEPGAGDLPSGCVVAGVVGPVLVWILTGYDRPAVGHLQAAALVVLAAFAVHRLWGGASRRAARFVFLATCALLVTFCWTFRPLRWESDEDVALPGPFGVSTDQVSVFDDGGRLHVIGADGDVEVSRPLRCEKAEQEPRRGSWERTAPAVVGSVACFGDGPDDPEGAFLCAVDRRSGQGLWTRPAGGRFPPAAGGEAVYVASVGPSGPGAPGGPRFRALDPATGAEVWNAPLPGTPRSFPALVLDDVVVAGAWDVGVVAFDRATGAERWRHVRRAVDNRTPGSGAGLVFVTSGSSGRYLVEAVDARSGRTRWIFDAPSVVAAAPSCADGHVVLGCLCPEATPGAGPTPERRPADGCLIALDAATGEELWRKRFAGEVPTGALARDGVAYFRAGELRAVDLDTGRLLWAAGRGAKPVAVLGGRLVAAGAEDVTLWRLVRPLF